MKINEIIKKVLVYGAGCVGKGVISRLASLDTECEIVGIAVSDSSKCDNNYLGYKIQNIECWKGCYDIPVLIAASSAYHQEIKENCLKNGFNNIVEVTPSFLDELTKYCYRKIFEKYNIDIHGKALPIGEAQYLNPFAENIPNTSGYLGQLGDFVIPMICNNYAMVNEGTYEFGNVKLKNGDIVLDLGSNLGTFSVYAASKGAIPYAFEPTPELQGFIKYHSELNENKVKLVPYAVSNTSGQTELFLDSFSCGGNSLLNRKESGEKNSAITVQQISVDEFVEQEKLERVDFIKADIEGAERLMLEGAENTLKKFAPKLALCTYHLPDDKEIMTDLILKANPNYKIEYKWEKLYAYV